MYAFFVKAQESVTKTVQTITKFTTSMKQIKNEINIVADLLSRLEKITIINYDDIAKKNLKTKN